jgi:2-polyprenyl-6-methoxyphenol hydroxylase-like FAD-dependent oxidoreductase
MHNTHIPIAVAEAFDADILICGSGAAGLTLAIDLARRGVSFCLIEKMDGPFHGSRGKGIQPRSQEIFEDLGVLDRIVAEGGAYPLQREYRDDGSYRDSQAVEREAPTPTEPYHLPLLAPQFRTEGVLRERLIELGSSPRFGASCKVLSKTSQA